MYHKWTFSTPRCHCYLDGRPSKWFHLSKCPDKVINNWLSGHRYVRSPLFLRNLSLLDTNLRARHQTPVIPRLNRRDSESKEYTFCLYRRVHGFPPILVIHLILGVSKIVTWQRSNCRLFNIKIVVVIIPTQNLGPSLLTRSVS